MNPPRFVIHQIDTSHSSALTIFDGSHEDESKLAKQFWSTVLMPPPVESTLVCKEIKQRIRSRSVKNESAHRKPSNSANQKKKEQATHVKEYEEIAILQRQKDEAKRIEANNARQKQLRQLFYQQAKINRIKNEQWLLPPNNDYLTTNHQYENDELFTAEENERDLVRSLPD